MLSLEDNSGIMWVHLPMKGAQGRFQAARSGKTFDTLETPPLARP